MRERACPGHSSRGSGRQEVLTTLFADTSKETLTWFGRFLLTLIKGTPGCGLFSGLTPCGKGFWGSAITLCLSSHQGHSWTLSRLTFVPVLLYKPFLVDLFHTRPIITLLRSSWLKIPIYCILMLQLLYALSVVAWLCINVWCFFTFFFVCTTIKEKIGTN